MKAFVIGLLLASVSQAIKLQQRGYDDDLGELEADEYAQAPPAKESLNKAWKPSELVEKRSDGHYSNDNTISHSILIDAVAQANTESWADAADRKTPSKPIEIGTIETDHMNLSEKSNMLHQVALSAETDLVEQDERLVSKEEEAYHSRMQMAEELDSQVIDLNKMSFSARDLNTFSALTDQNAHKTWEEKSPAVQKMI